MERPVMSQKGLSSALQTHIEYLSNTVIEVSAVHSAQHPHLQLVKDGNLKCSLF